VSSFDFELPCFDLFKVQALEKSVHSPGTSRLLDEVHQGGRKRAESIIIAGPPWLFLHDILYL
jgi:hypothetical protein